MCHRASAALLDGQTGLGSIKGTPELVSRCPASEQLVVRFVNEGEVKGGGRHYITCSGDVGQ